LRSLLVSFDSLKLPARRFIQQPELPEQKRELFGRLHSGQRRMFGAGAVGVNARFWRNFVVLLLGGKRPVSYPERALRRWYPALDFNH
jgi:hypothetical protein